MADKQLMPPVPCLLAALICDKMFLEVGTEKHTIVGVFENLAAPEFPAMHPRMTFFFQLTNGHGKTPVSVKLVHVQESGDEELYSQTMDLEFNDVRQTVSGGMTINGLRIPQEGEYRFQIYARGELLGERRFICRKLGGQ